MKYFKLFSNAKFDFDKKGGCILNLFNYTRINLDSLQVRKMLDLLERHIEDVNHLDAIEKNLMLQLMNKGMGYLYESDIFNEEHLDNRGFEIRGLSESAPAFDKIYIQSSQLCNGKCKFCSNESEIIYGGCNSCKKWKNINNENTVILENTKLKEIIIRITQLFVKTIVFSGGNPFINWAQVKELIQLIKMKLKDVEIKVITNGSYLNDEIFEFCIENNIKIIFTVLGYDELSYAKVTGNKFIYSDLINAIKSCINKKIEYEITILAKSSDLTNIINFIDLQKWNLTSIAEIHEMNIPFKSIKCYNERMINNASDFRKNQKYNSCLYGKLAINLYGNMQPCPMIGDQLVDLASKDISIPFQNFLIDKYWRMTKQQVSSCKDCPYKFSCEDCTVIELAINSEIINGESICNRIK